MQRTLKGFMKSHNTLETDAITGIYNLMGFERVLRKSIHRKTTKDYLIAVFDIEKYYELLNRYGYVMGDKLQHTIVMASSHFDEHVVLAKLERHTFLLYMPYDVALLEKIIATFEDSIDQMGLEHKEGVIHLRVGAYKIPRDQVRGDLHKLIDCALMAHNMAILPQQENLIWYNEQVQQIVEQQRYYREHALDAIDRREFKLYLQPQVDMADVEKITAEALVRWVLPSGRIAYPESFVSHLEHSGMITNLDFYMLESVCDFLKHHIEKGYRPFRISINISHMTFATPDLVERFTQIIDESGVAYEYIGIEIHEASLVSLSEHELVKLALLKKKGIHIAIDAFASGYASLRLLPSLPIDVIKLDRKYLRAYDADDRVLYIIESIVELAHKLGLKVTCEGIEHQRDLELLHQVGCDLVQGYYLLKPLPQKEFIQSVDDAKNAFAEKILG